MRAPVLFLIAFLFAHAPAHAAPPLPDSPAQHTTPLEEISVPISPLSVGGIRASDGGISPAGTGKGFCYTNPFPLGAILKNTNNSDGAAGNPPQLAEPTTFHVLVLRVRFSDEPFTLSTAAHAAFFDSVRDFWLENSFGLARPTFTISDVYHSTNTRGFYGGNDCIQNTNCTGNIDFVVDVASDPQSNVLSGNGTNAQADFDYRPFDHVMFFTAGTGQESSGASDDFWALYLPMRDEIAPCLPSVGNQTYTIGTQGFAMGDRCFDGAVFVSEQETSGASPLGIIIHEYGHQLGAVDLYNTFFGTTVVDDWSIMDGGAWTGSPAGSQPAHLDPWHKIFMKYATAVDAPIGQATYTLGPSSQVVKAVGYNSDVQEEYFLLEYRDSGASGSSFDKAIPGDGILIWHIDDTVGTPTLNNVNVGLRKRVTIDPADGTSPETVLSDAGDPYPGSSNVTIKRIDNHNKLDSGLYVDSIGAAGGATQSFDLYVPLTQPTSLTAIAVSSTEVKFDWDTMESFGVSGYELLTSTGGVFALSLPGGNSSYTDNILTPNQISNVKSVRAFVADVATGTAEAFEDTYSYAAFPLSTQYVSPQGATSVNFTWGTNTNPSGTTYEFDVYASTDLTGQVTDLTAQTTNEGSYELTGLTPDTTYTMTISALNANQVAPSALTVGTTVTNAADPTSFALQVAYLSSMTIQWNANSNPSDTRYEIVFSSDAFSTFLDTAPFATGSQTAFTGLVSETTYTFRIRARSRLDILTPFSSPITVWMVPNNGGQAITNSNGGTVSFLNLSLGIPAGTFGQDTTVSLVVPQTFPSASNSTGVTMRPTGIGVEVLVPDNLQPMIPLPLTIGYSNTDVAGLVESLFIVARYEPTTSQWIPLPSVANPSQNRVVAELNHLSLFQVMEFAPSNTDIENVVAFPNPLRIHRGEAMTFANVPPNSRLRVYTVAGEQVADILAVGSNARWNGRNLAGNPVGSGVYIVLVQDDANGQKGTFKIMVER